VVILWFAASRRYRAFLTLPLMLQKKGSTWGKCVKALPPCALFHKKAATARAFFLYIKISVYTGADYVFVRLGISGYLPAAAILNPILSFVLGKTFDRLYHNTLIRIYFQTFLLRIFLCPFIDLTFNIFHIIHLLSRYCSF